MFQPVTIKWKLTCGIIVGFAVAKTAYWPSVFLRVLSNDNTGQNVGLFIHLIHSGLVETR